MRPLHCVSHIFIFYLGGHKNKAVDQKVVILNVLQNSNCVKSFLDMDVFKSLFDDPPKKILFYVYLFPRRKNNLLDFHVALSGYPL